MGTQPKVAAAESAHALAGRVLRGARLFRHWPPALVDELSTACRIETFQPHTSILLNGESARALYVVAAGSVEFSAASPDGHRLVILYGGPEWIFGLRSVLDGKPMNHDCRAYEPTTVVAVSKSTFLGLLQREPMLWESVTQLFMERSRFILAQLAGQAFEPLRVRLVRALLVLVDSYSSSGTEGVAIKLRLGKDRLGDLLGVSRQSISKEIKRLEREGVLLMHYGQVLVRDMPAMEAIAGLNTTGTASG